MHAARRALKLVRGGRALLAAALRLRRLQRLREADRAVENKHGPELAFIDIVPATISGEHNGSLLLAVETDHAHARGAVEDGVAVRSGAQALAGVVRGGLCGVGLVQGRCGVLVRMPCRCIWKAVVNGCVHECAWVNGRAGGGGAWTHVQVGPAAASPTLHPRHPCSDHKKVHRQ